MLNLDLDQICLPEYSPKQGCFHIETAREMMENNLRQIVGGWTNSYLPFAVCGTHEEASQACDTLARAMLERGARTDKFGVTIRMPGEALQLQGRFEVEDGRQTRTA